MRVLVAYDGSEGAANAARMATAIAVPPHGTLRVLAAVSPSPIAMSPGWAGGLPEAVHDARRAQASVFERQVGSVVDDFTDRGIEADGAVLEGYPARVIVEQARAFDADVVVVGSRGRGAIEGLLLGSVSAEVLDNAHCPVLVARRPTITRVVFGFDGSEPADRARHVLSSWPVFETVPVRVVAVAAVAQAWHTGIAPTLHGQVVASYAEDLAHEREAQAAAATVVVEQLAGAGRAADCVVRAGDPATEIVATARDSGADLIVLGSHGRTGLSRVLLGSVARTVARESNASVLVVRNG